VKAEEDQKKMMTSHELLKERGWDKQISDKIKALIDEKIIVLRQDYEEQKNKASGPAGGEGGEGPVG